MEYFEFVCKYLDLFSGLAFRQPPAPRGRGRFHTLTVAGLHWNKHHRWPLGLVQPQPRDHAHGLSLSARAEAYTYRPQVSFDSEIGSVRLFGSASSLRHWVLDPPRGLS